MSSYFQTLKKYKRDYQISSSAQLVLALHYPLFKLDWLSSYGSGFKKKMARNLTSYLRYYKIMTTLPFGNHQVNFEIDFKPDSVSSFKEIFWGGEYHVKNKIPEVNTMVDLGSNTGMAALDLLSRYRPKRILCVEGNDQLLPKLKKLQSQVSENCDFIIEHKCVTGNYNGPVTFVIASNHRESRVVYGKEEGGFTCNGKSLRSLLDDHNFQKVDLLKIDIEGGEYDILEKDGEVFKRFRDILIEIHGNDDKRAQFRQNLGKIGFDLMEIKPAPGCDCEIAHFRRKSSA